MLLEFIGGPPAIEGHVCEGLICEGYQFQGESVATANVTYLKFNSIWHRLCFDPGSVHWRIWPTEPEPWAVNEDGLAYPHVNVGFAAGLIGMRLESYSTAATERATSVVFTFENGCRVLIEAIDDHTNYRFDYVQASAASTGSCTRS